MLFSRMLFCVTMLCDRIRQRVHAASDGRPESGALTLEWIVIAGILVALALSATLIFKGAITHWEGDLTKGG